MESKFKIAVEGMKKSDIGAISDQEKMVLYKYYKQALEADNSSPKPEGIMKFKAKMKWSAWESVKGMSKEIAIKKYIETALRYLPSDVVSLLK